MVLLAAAAVVVEVTLLFPELSGLHDVMARETAMSVERMPTVRTIVSFLHEIKPDR
jgi:acyl-CoA hydrolase